MIYQSIYVIARTRATCGLIESLNLSSASRNARLACSCWTRSQVNSDAALYRCAVVLLRTVLLGRPSLSSDGKGRYVDQKLPGRQSQQAVDLAGHVSDEPPIRSEVRAPRVAFSSAKHASAENVTGVKEDFVSTGAHALEAPASLLIEHRPINAHSRIPNRGFQQFIQRLLAGRRTSERQQSRRHVFRCHHVLECAGVK